MSGRTLTDLQRRFMDDAYKRAVEKIGEDGRRRCSPSEPCDGRYYPNGHLTHLLLWGECFIEKVADGRA